MEKVQIQGVPETMLQTLYARAAYSGRENAGFRDEKAMEMVSRLEYDFSSAQKDAMMSKGVIARTGKCPGCPPGSDEGTGDGCPDGRPVQGHS